MLGFKIKRGVEASVERIFKSTGREFDSLSFSWSGKTAAVSFTREAHGVVARIIFPNIDDNADVPESKHHDLVGFAVHELGHVWFTENEPWDLARQYHGAFVGALINGLEDPRIEQCVIDSGYVPNGRVLFNHVVQSVLLKEGYAEPDDFKNIPFMLAIEGRRLNGYSIPFPSVLPDSPWREDLEWALHQPATSTADIAETAIELNRRLQEKKEQQDQQGDQQQDGQQDGQDGQQDQQQGKKQGKQGKQEDKVKPVELGDALSDQLSDLIPEGRSSRVPIATQIRTATFTWE
jgi:hypothetical protein